MSEHQALVQTMDFFTPIVDDPYAYGQIAAANALSDVYAMGGRPITAMNICCFDPSMAPAEVWADVLRGMADKVAESGAALVGGHSVEDPMPKFGLSVTGLIDPKRMLHNAGAEIGDSIYLSKPLGTGIITSAGKWDDEIAYEMMDFDAEPMPPRPRSSRTRGWGLGPAQPTEESLPTEPRAQIPHSAQRGTENSPSPPLNGARRRGSPLTAAILWMSQLNRDAAEKALQTGAKCATDITGFGLAGHLFNIARSSNVAIEIDSNALPLLPRVKELVERGNLTGGSKKNREHIAERLIFAGSVPKWLQEVILDPQTSGGLAIFSKTPIDGYPCVGRVIEGAAELRVR